MTTLNVLTVELETARKIFWLLLNDHVFLTSYNSEKKDWDDGTYPAINCNDLFVMGADAENLAAEDLDLYIEVMKKWPNAGDAAWCAVKRAERLWRNTDPSKWTDDYKEALEGVTKLLCSRGNQNDKV